MNRRVVSLSDRGRALEWLSLGFGIWLIGSLVFALLALEMVGRVGPDGSVQPDPALALVCTSVNLFAVGAIALGLATLVRTESWLWSFAALMGLSVVLIDNTALLWLPRVDLVSRTLDWQVVWGITSVAHIAVVVAVLQVMREIASSEESHIPLIALGVAVAAEIARSLLIGYLPLDEHLLERDPMLPWARAGLIAVASTASLGLVLLAIRSASAAVAGQIWAGDLGVTSPARAGDWQRVARGLDRFGAFLIGKIAIASAAIPLMIISVLVGLGAFSAVRVYLVPLASALASAGMAAGLLACRRVPDPPDARAGFTGAALLIAACLVADLYLLAARAGEPLAEAISSLGHLVAYLALLRSVGRIAERLGDSDLTRRARAYGRLAIVTVPGATISGFLLLRYPADLAAWIAVPIAMAAVSFAALLPCALLARQLARTLRARFAEPPRAVVRAS